ncbi:hypothetical protein [Formosa sp. PL04]|uniref:hypothetical protein n=1 Tax=Formosa sp. PL04 TaxID=3081755 RepID=UPI002981E17C|nr:hypothetical protein [Formosa sp. PL04]MDW5289712.1 hypothetical protein [Formosa sp. PL04]
MPFFFKVSLDSHAVSAKRFGDYYKNHFRDFKDWSQKEHAQDWLLFGKNLEHNLEV